MSDRQLRLPPSVTTGRLEGISVPDLLWALSRSGSTGVLEVVSRDVTKHVFLAEGRIVFASSTDPSDRLGERLLREGEIRLDHLEEAVGRVTEGKRLGTVLVEAGHLPPERLVRGVIAQVHAIVLDLFALEEGEYRFDEGPLPRDEVITLNMKTGEILLEGIRRVRSLHRIRRSVGSPHTRYRLADCSELALAGLKLSDGERNLLDRLGTEGADVGALCRDVFLSNFETYQALWAFKVIGAIEEVERSAATDAGALLEGRLGEETFGALLVRLARSGEKGILRLVSGTHERTFHLADGRCLFATSNNVDDGLIAHLLRRGIISLQDREEVARRVLSNKRVGTILLQLGVLSESDLRSLVRQQLCEIVCDSFRWTEGDWFFRSGELPTLEEITLDMSLEDLVIAGTRRVTAWKVVARGAGGVSARLVLTPDYLSILDRMSTFGSEDWEILSALAEPMTAAEACRRARGGDFATFQTLWALRLLGAIREAPAEAARSVEMGPIAPAEVSEEAPFELTGADELTPAALRPEGTIAPSSWVEPADESLGAPSAWGPTQDEPSLEVAPADPEPAEVISETWRLAAEPVPQALHGSLSEGDSDLLGEGIDGEPVRDAVTSAPPVFELAQPEADLPERSQAVAPQAPAEAPAPADPDRTVALSRGEIEAAIFGPPEAVNVEPPAPETPTAPTAPTGEDAEPPFEPPPEAEEQIVRFNARHKVVFRTIRAEVGAGAQNFVRSCRGALHDASAPVFDDVELHADGTFDVLSLRRGIASRRVLEPWPVFQQLLDQEISMLRMHVGEKRTSALVEEMERL